MSRQDVASRAALISKTYRDGGNSGAITSETDALAYALARMPATYAAVAACLNALQDITARLRAADPLLDVGAGPGTASWAAAEAFPTLAAFTLLDANPALRTLALEFAKGSSRFSAASYELGPAHAPLAQADEADLVDRELPDRRARREPNAAISSDAMWAKTRDTLLIIEPGTPAGYARIIAARAQLIAAGAHVAAPCPHDAQCPLAAARLVSFLPAPRPLARAQADQGRRRAVRGREVLLCRADASAARAASLPRAGAADAGKAEIAAKLCTPDGLAVAKVPRRDKPAYAARPALALGRCASTEKS